MVRRLETTLKDPDPASRVIGCLGKHFGEQPLTDMIGTGARNKDAPRTEQPHGAIVDFLVAPKGAFQAFPVFGESRGIQNDGVVPRAFLMLFTEKVKDIGLDAPDVDQTVSLGIGLCQLDSGPRNIDCLNLLAQIADLECEAPGIAERIERAASRIAACGPAVVALVEVGACLLAAGEGDGHLLPVFVDDQCLRERLAHDLLPKFQTFEFPHPAIIPEENGTRLIALCENRPDERLDPVGGLDEALNNKPVVVTIDDQSGQQIAFGVDAAAEQRIHTETFTQQVGGGKTFPKEFFIDGNGATGKKSKSNLGSRAEEGLADNAPALVAHGYDIARLSFLAIENIAPIYPQVSAANPIRATFADDNIAGFHYAEEPPCTFPISITNCLRRCSRAH